MEKVNSILVLYRLTGRCKPVVHAAASEARNHHAELFVLHVIHDPFGLEGWNIPHPSLEKDFLHLMATARKEMDELVAEERRLGMEVKELIREGKPEEEIEKVVRDENIDLLVLPSHEESRLEHFFFGRENEDIIRRMPCSILLVKREPKPAPYPWPA